MKTQSIHSFSLLFQLMMVGLLMILNNVQITTCFWMWKWVQLHWNKSLYDSLPQLTKWKISGQIEAAESAKKPNRGFHLLYHYHPLGLMWKHGSPAMIYGKWYRMNALEKDVKCTWRNPWIIWKQTFQWNGTNYICWWPDIAIHCLPTSILVILYS